MAAAVAASMGNMSPLGILVVSVFCVTACRASSFSPPSAWQPSWLSLESDMKIAGTHPPQDTSPNTDREETCSPWMLLPQQPCLNRPPARGPPSPNLFTILLKSAVLRAPQLRTKLSAVTKQLHTSTPGLSRCSLTTPGSVAAR